MERLIRHGDRITYFARVTDPLFMEEPYSKTVILIRNIKDPVAWLYACDDGEEIIGRPDDKIPNFLFGKNPFLREWAEKNQVPLLGALGGGQTMHPEFAAKLKDPAAADTAAMARVVPDRGPQRQAVR